MNQNTGKQFINGQRVSSGAAELVSIDAGSGKPLPYTFYQATPEEADRAAEAADEAFYAYSTLPLSQRARFLEAIAEQIEALGEDFISIVCEESGLPAARIAGERARTANQMRMFAASVRDGSFLGVRIDTFEGTGKPALRQMNIGIGPVAVFGASNFPLAFSTAGGDTASALAAGCPVVFKAHSGHMRTAEVIAEAILTAAEQCDVPAGVFNMIFGGRIGAKLVEHPRIKAVGFTGSLHGGKALINIANARPDPIPVFAEMSSINPVIMLDGIMESSAEKLAEETVASFTMGTGQFCTKPGLIIGFASEGFNRFVDKLTATVGALSPMMMLNPSTLHSYNERKALFDNTPELTLLASGQAEENRAQAALYRADAAFVAGKNPLVQEEIFGPAAIVISVESKEALLQVLSALQGQLTVTLFGEDQEIAESGYLVNTLQSLAGRLIVNGYPTGVEVCQAMVHGGPWPATSDARGTSVGSLAINRFLRPVCFQNYPESLLPLALKDSNPLQITRLVNGVMQK